MTAQMLRFRRGEYDCQFRKFCDISHRLLTSPFPPALPGLAIVKKGQTLRIIDLEGNQAVDCILYSAARPCRTVQRVRNRSARRRTFSSPPARA